VTEPNFAILPEEAFFDGGVTLGGLRVLRLVWTLCLREGRIAWSDYLTSREMAKAAGLQTNRHLAQILRKLVELDYVILGPSPAEGIYSIRPHHRFGETGPSSREMGKLFRTSPVGEGRNALNTKNEAKQGVQPTPAFPCGGFTTTDSIPHSDKERSSSSSSRSLGRKPFRPSPIGEDRNGFFLTPTQQAILDLLAENGMEGTVPMQATLKEGMTFRRALLLVNDGSARNQSTGMILTRLKGRDIPPKVCPLCGAKEGFHYGFTDGDRDMNCPVSDDPDMTDEALAAAWRHIRGKKIQLYWMGQEIEE